MMSLLWFYRPEHTDIGRQAGDCGDEVFAKPLADGGRDFPLGHRPAALPQRNVAYRTGVGAPACEVPQQSPRHQS